VWGGNCHVEGKVLSLFEPHTEVIRKGKAHKPNEFSRLVRIDEVENGIVSAYQVSDRQPGRYHILDAGPPTTSSVLRARARRWPRAIEVFFSAKNQRAAQELGVKKVALPGARTSLSQAGQAAEAALVPASAALASRL